MCLVVGLVNGWLVAKAGVAPFIATLGTLYVARGAALLISNGKTFPNLAGQAARGNTGFPALGQSFLLGVPLPVWIMLVLFGIAPGSRGEDATWPACLRGRRQRTRGAAGRHSRAAGQAVYLSLHPRSARRSWA